MSPRLDALRVRADRGHDAAPAACVGARRHDQPAPGPALGLDRLDHEVVVERLERDRQMPFVRALHAQSLPASTIRAKELLGARLLRRRRRSARAAPARGSRPRRGSRRGRRCPARSPSRAWRSASSSRRRRARGSTLSTSATSSGSSALVISSSSISFGRSASARTIATRCCCPPERLSGYASRLVGEAEAPSSSSARASASARESPSALRGPSVTFRSTAQVREEVVRLEHDPDLAADAVDVDAARGDLLAVDDDPAGVDPLEQVDAAEQRRLARARRADQAHDLVLRDREVDPAQDLVPAERLADAFERARQARPPARGGGRARSASP